ncbi:F-box protein-like [Iris pallida]|uniref:F-box protein-like n=1 Tax=Iris pallida TaxID=29817 RepID=A0AAX6F7L4_IRIPA|nr:F-box protein-like [Iris pallida]
MVDILSDDLAMEVLVRLPVRSIMRFRCVSKAWNSLISELGRRHRDRLPPAMVGYIQQYNDTTKFTGIGRRSCYSSDLLAATGAGARGPDFSFMPLCYAQENRRIVSVCNGLVLCRHSILQPEPYELCPYEHCHIVCNPATKRWKRLPETSDCDPVADQRLPRRRHYRVLGEDTRMHPGPDTFRFKMFVSETGSWVDCPGGLPRAPINSEAMFYADGIFYVSVVYNVAAVAAVHLLAVEEAGCRRILLPPGMRPDRFEGSLHRDWSMSGVCPCLGTLDGVLRLATGTQDEILVWALEAGGWVPKHAVDLLGVGRERLAEIGADPGLLSTVRFLKFHPDVDVIFLCSPGTVLSYHLGADTFEEMSSDAVDANSYFFPPPPPPLPPHFFFPYSPCYSEELDL